MLEQHGFGSCLVTLKGDRTPVGCGLIKQDSLDLGFAFAPEHRGKEYARKAAAMTVAYARDVLGLRRVVAVAALDNAASLRLLEGLEFAFERTINPPNSGAVHLLSRHLAE